MAAVADTPAAVADTGSDRAAALTSGMVGKSEKSFTASASLCEQKRWSFLFVHKHAANCVVSHDCEVYMGTDTKGPSLGFLPQFKSISLKLQKTFVTHLTQFIRHSAPVDRQIIRKLLPVKRDRDVRTVLLLRLFREIRDQFFPRCAP
jgi:hypothetical protein